MDTAALQLNVHLMWDSPLACQVLSACEYDSVAMAPYGLYSLEQVMASVQHKSVVQGSSMMVRTLMHVGECFVTVY